MADPFEHIAGLTDKAEPVESPETAAPSTGRSERSTETNGAALNSVPAAKLIKRIPIVVQPGKFHSIVNQAIKELRAAKVMFFHRAGEIVMPVVDEVATFKGRRTRVVRLKPVGVDLMRYELSQVVNWVKFDGRSKTQIPVIRRWKLPKPFWRALSNFRASPASSPRRHCGQTEAF